MSTFIDIGSYDGQEIEWALEHGYEVHAFEPNPAMTPILQEKFGNNPKCHLNFAAAWHSDGTAKLYRKNLERETDMGNSLIKEKTNIDTEADDVHTINIGRYLRDLDKNIDVLKVDAEGAEYIILDSIIHNFGLHRIKHIFVEDHSALIYNWHDHKNKILERCKKEGIVLKDWLGVNFSEEELI